MNKLKLDEFLGAKTQSPLDTDKIYGGSAQFTVEKETVRTIRRVKN